MVTLLHYCLVEIIMSFYFPPFLTLFVSFLHPIQIIQQGEVCGRGQMGPNAQWEVMKIDMHDMNHPIVGFRHVRTGKWLMLKNWGMDLCNGNPRDLDHCRFMCEHNADHTFCLIKERSMDKRVPKMLGFEESGCKADPKDRSLQRRGPRARFYLFDSGDFDVHMNGTWRGGDGGRMGPGPVAGGYRRPMGGGGGRMGPGPVAGGYGRPMGRGMGRQIYQRAMGLGPRPMMVPRPMAMPVNRRPQAYPRPMVMPNRGRRPQALPRPMIRPAMRVPPRPVRGAGAMYHNYDSGGADSRYSVGGGYNSGYHH